MQKLPSIIKFPAPSSGKVTLETQHKNGYADMQADYHIDSEDCIDITTGWNLSPRMALRSEKWPWCFSTKQKTPSSLQHLHSRLSNMKQTIFIML